MNNVHKVRIYDLSKELNLENKEILEICAQLNIAVKSHSSTITESQVERIKVMAEKYITKQSMTQGNDATMSGEKKQQILAIHHKQIQSSTEEGLDDQANDLEVPDTSVSSQMPAAPKPPEKPISSTSIKSPKTDRISLSKPSISKEKTSKSESIDFDLPDSSKENFEKPVNKPSRTKPSLEGKNKVKLSKRTPKGISLKPKEKPEITGSTNEVQSKKKPNIGKPDLKKSSSHPVEEEKKYTMPFDPLDSSLIIDDDDDESDEILDIELKPKPQLKRPTTPRIFKKKTWEEEEEEENKAKASKASTKAKRRFKALEDEDDDFESESESNTVSLSLSLSIARPPKPKSEHQTAEVVHKPKKPTLKTIGSGSERSRSERKERKETPRQPEKVILEKNLTVRELSERLHISETEIIKLLFTKGTAVNITQTLDQETAKMVTESFGIIVEIPEEDSAAIKNTEMIDEGDLDNLQRRPPVVTIIGHVDHGKTTLLDSIRKTKVAQGEAGGITQHIGAYHVDIEHDNKKQQLVFLDTPGHEAFTAMRARGARITDIAILVVAADDGVQPQTREAISHAKAAEVPIVVAINKIDKLESNSDRIKQELSDLGLVPEEWGGDTIMVPVSALKGDNLDQLLEMLVLVSEIEDLLANPDRLAKGTVIEAHLDKNRGPVATLLIQNGTLRVGDSLVAGPVFGKIRAMVDDRGDKVKEASPSFAVEILGLSSVPAAGDEFDIYLSEKEARAVADKNAKDSRQTRLQQALSSRRVTLSTLSAKAKDGELKELNLILKADVQGSIEAILGSLEQLPQTEVQIRVLLAAPGEVTETDVDLAAASGAVIIGFNTNLANGVKTAADQEEVDIREYDIIYKLLDDIQGAMEGLLEPEEIESPLGQAEVRAVFPVGRGAVAGCYVLSGKVVRNRFIRVVRDGNTIYQGTLDSLKRMKEDVREVNSGYECGIGIDKFSNWNEGDTIEAFEMIMKRRTLIGRTT